MATPAPYQVCMTLSALAATAATTRPSGEELVDQQWRVLAGLTKQLGVASLATQGKWQVAWLALSPGNANMAYIARTTDGSNQFAVVARGTIGNPTDILEDLDVGTVVPFTASGSPTPVAVSKGALTAFTEVTTAVLIPPSADGSGGEIPEVVVSNQGATLLQALAGLLQEAPSTPRPTVYVTGHSLGGCIATMLAPYLYTQAQSWPNVPRFAVQTFAAPTAGLQSLVTYVNGLPWFLNDHFANAWDVVPLAWNSLKSVNADKWYPSPGPAGTIDVHVLFDEINALSGDNLYVQPGNQHELPANGAYSTHNSDLTNSTLADFLGMVAHQHANDIYLDLLEAPRIPAGPAVTSVSPQDQASGSTVVIDGSGFTPDSAVDFGPIPCTAISISTDGTQITAVVPDGVGIVDVRVTTLLGTSPAVPLGQFAYDGPAPMVVTGVSPAKGPVGTTVTISGAGFPKSATVQFKDQPGDSVTWVSDTELTVKSPKGLTDGRTVDITVWLDDIGTATSPADEFTPTLFD
jgi:hypothetical protein